MAKIEAAVKSQHDVSVKRLKDWIALPAIAAENRDMQAGAEYMAALAQGRRLQQRQGAADRRPAGRVRDDG